MNNAKTAEQLTILKNESNWVDQGFQNYGHFISVLFIYDLIEIFNDWGFNGIELMMGAIGL